MTYDLGTLINTILIAAIGGLIGWFSQDMRKRVSNIERRLGAIVRATFYIMTSDRRPVPTEARLAIEEAMKEIK